MTAVEQCREGRTEVGSDRDAKLASAACLTCGWSKVFGFARPTGEPVALRLARLWAANHEAGESVALEAEIAERTGGTP